MRATAARNGHIRAWQLFHEDYPVVLAPTTVMPTPGPREDASSPERAREIFWNDLRYISAINVLGLPGAASVVGTFRTSAAGAITAVHGGRADLPTSSVDFRKCPKAAV